MHWLPCFGSSASLRAIRLEIAAKMRSSTALVCAIAVTACTGTEGDLLRSKASSEPPDAATARPRPMPLQSWQIQLSGTLDASLDVKVYISDLETPTSVLRAWHDAGRIALCYFS